MVTITSNNEFDTESFKEDGKLPLQNDLTSRLLAKLHSQAIKHQSIVKEQQEFLKEHASIELNKKSNTVDGKLPFEDAITTRLLSKLHSQAKRHKSIAKKQQDFLKGVMIPNSIRKSNKEGENDIKIKKSKRKPSDVKKEKEENFRKKIVPSLQDGSQSLPPSGSSSKRQIRRMSMHDEEMFKNAEKELVASKNTMKIINDVKVSKPKTVHVAKPEKSTKPCNKRAPFLELVQTIEKQRQEAKKKRSSETSQSECKDLYIDVVGLYSNTKKDKVHFKI